MILQYYMVHGNVFPPIRSNPSDAGLDLRWSPADTSISAMRIEPGESKLLQTGCMFAIPHGFMMEIKNRSSMAAKKNLIVGACVVDSGYGGEVFVNIHNIGVTDQFIEPGDKIAQAIIIPVVHARFVASETPDIYDWYPITISNRGDGALGSTGK
jgi:dUTP pyrophosphatase